MILNDCGALLRSTMTMPPIACSDACRLIFVGWGFPVLQPDEPPEVGKKDPHRLRAAKSS